jgi:hypothetical protein
MEEKNRLYLSLFYFTSKAPICMMLPVFFFFDIYSLIIPQICGSNKLTYQAKISQVYYLTFMCCSTCFGHLHAHQQELTTALTASGFTLECGGSSVVGCGLATGQTTTNNVACICKLLMMGVEAPETC